MLCVATHIAAGAQVHVLSSTTFWSTSCAPATLGSISAGNYYHRAGHRGAGRQRTGAAPRPQGTFSARFKAPDVYGVFKLRVAHRRLGYTPIELEQQARRPAPRARRLAPRDSVRWVCLAAYALHAAAGCCRELRAVSQRPAAASTCSAPKQGPSLLSRSDDT